MNDEHIVVGRSNPVIGNLLEEILEVSGGSERLAEQASKEKIEALRQKHVEGFGGRR